MRWAFSLLFHWDVYQEYGGWEVSGRMQETQHKCENRNRMAKYTTQMQKPQNNGSEQQRMDSETDVDNDTLLWHLSQSQSYYICVASPAFVLWLLHLCCSFLLLRCGSWICPDTSRPPHRNTVIETDRHIPNTSSSTTTLHPAHALFWVFLKEQVVCVPLVLALWKGSKDQ